MVQRAVWAVMAMAVAGCRAPGGGERAAPVVRVVDQWAQVAVEGSPALVPAAGVEWRFGPEMIARGEDVAPGGVRALMGARSLAWRENRLAGEFQGMGLVAFRLPDHAARGLLHRVEVRLRVSAGARLGVILSAAEQPTPQVLGQSLSFGGDLGAALEPGSEMVTYTVTSADTNFAPSFSLDGLQWLVVRPSDAPSASFEIESLRLVSLAEHLQSIPSGVGWHGLGDVFREAIVARAPETLRLQAELPARPWLDLSVGTAQAGRLTFVVSAEAGGRRRELLRHTVTRPGRWQSFRVPFELSGRSTLAFALEADTPGHVGYWGAPAIRSRAAAAPVIAEASPERRALAEEAPPQGVVVVIADTLRRDHLDFHGYERPVAPRLREMADGGVVFLDTIAQGTWTKVSVPSILTGLYATTTGIVENADRLAASIDTMAEVYRAHGYATFYTSSVPFSGKLSNLHQGVEVMHESTSIADGEGDIEGLGLGSKTARSFVDRLLPWLDEHRDVPFFVVLHVMDPHSPYRPYAPFDRLWLDADSVRAHEQELRTVTPAIESPLMKVMQMPTRAELDAAGVDAARFLEHELAWYDGSIRAMNEEIARVLEKLQGLGLLERTAVAFVADHGEEFLEHGRHWHGNHAYGEMLNVPMAIAWPAGLPAGKRVAATVHTIDLMPTLLELSRLPIPAAVQGKSLLPLLVAPEGEAAQQLAARTVFSERRAESYVFNASMPNNDSLVAISGGWKLIHNIERRTAGEAEYELFDHRADPLNLENVAARHPDLVSRLRAEIERWQKEALAARAEDAGKAEMSEGERARLRALGYIQ